MNGRGIPAAGLVLGSGWIRVRPPRCSGVAAGGGGGRVGGVEFLDGTQGAAEHLDQEVAHPLARELGAVDPVEGGAFDTAHPCEQTCAREWRDALRPRPQDSGR